MSRKIIITSGKGGVGKTTITANLGLELAKSGLRVMLVDGDMGLNNLDVMLGVENQIVFDLIDVLNGKCRTKQALVECPINSNLFVLPCAHSLSGVEITGQKLKSAIESVEELFDFVLIDCPAGIDLSFHRAMSIANEAICVVMPSINSVRDADKVISILKSYNLSSIKLIVNKIRGDLVINNQMYSAEDIENTLNVPLLGVIPEDDEILKGLVESLSKSEKVFKLIAKNLNGKSEKIYDYLKKYSGFWGSIRREIRKWLWKNRI